MAREVIVVALLVVVLLISTGELISTVAINRKMAEERINVATDDEVMISDEDIVEEINNHHRIPRRSWDSRNGTPVDNHE